MSERSCRIGRPGRAFVVSVVLALAGCGSSAPELSGADFAMPETAVLYDIDLQGMPSEEMATLAEESLTVYRYQDRGASSLALLRRRAENDRDTIKQILKSNGYYKGSAEIAVDEIPEADYVDQIGWQFPSFSDLAFWKKNATPGVEDVAKTYARVVIKVDPGTQFTLTRHDFALIDPESGASVPSPASLGSPVGGAAYAAPIVGAEAAAKELLRSDGYPYADTVDRDAVADLANATLEVNSQLFSGPATLYGPVVFTGLKDVKESYLRTYIPWQPGELVDRDMIRKFTRDLLATDLFDTAVVTLPSDAPEVDGPVAVPITVEAEERPFRTVSAGAEYSTDTGPGATAGFEHRNLWGANETLTTGAQLAVTTQSLNVAYREPQFRRPGEDLVSTLELIHDEDDAFDETRATLTGGIEYELTDQWKIGYGGLVEASRISDTGPDSVSYLAGIPTFVAYDGTDDLLNPTKGARARLELTPFAGIFASSFTDFFTADLQASTYWDITGEKDYVLAGRVRVASILSDSLSDVPKNQRLYAGGGGSVRGYARRFVGPLDAQGDPVGGRSALELSTELRAKLYGDLGGVVFVDAGEVDSDSLPDVRQLRFAAGFGIRYYSPAGPIRLDIAFPIDARPVDDPFQLYFSIGQAF